MSCDPNNNPVTGKDCAPATCSNGVCQTPPPPCVPGGACKALGAVGECANGTITCPSGGGTSCAPGPRTAEICDGKDNDCDGIVDNLPAHNDTVLDAAITRNGNLFGISDNTMYGPSDCGGTRVSASATKSSGGGDCSVVDWADIACQTPDKHIGNSTLTAACKVFKQQGGVPGNNSHDCRYIVHVGAPSTQGVVCQASHFFAVQPICP